jgi:Tfp pilus assembly protein PilN
MFTLLPTAQKDKLAKEYRLRLAVMLVSVLGIALFVSCVLLFPSYVLSNAKINETVSKKKDLESSPLFAERTQLRKTVETTQGELALVGTAAISATAVIDEVESLKSAEIKLLHIEYQHNLNSGTLILNGRAATRQALLDYQKALQASADFKAVDFPISDLSKRVDIEFTITITGQF